MRETFTKIAETVFHPERVRQRALGELHSAAATRLQTGETTFFPADPVWVAKNHRRGVFPTTQGTVILDVDVTANNEMPDNPAKILIGDGGMNELTRADSGQFGITSMGGRTRRVPTKSIRRLTNALASESPSSTK